MMVMTQLESRLSRRWLLIAAAVIAMVIAASPAHAKTKKGTLAAGEPLFKALRSAGASPAAILELVRNVRPQLDLERQARPGDSWTVNVSKDGSIKKFTFTGKRGSATWPPGKKARRAAKEAEREKRQVAETEARPTRRSGDLIGQWLDATGRERDELGAEIGRKWSPRVFRRKLAARFRYKPVKSGMHRYKTAAGADYMVVVGRRYRHKKASPLHVSLHGGGGTGPQNCRSRWHRHGGLGNLLVVCPTSPSGHWTTAPAEKIVLDVLADVHERFNVQSDHVSVGGGSNGGTGTWHMAAKYPWMWAAVVPRAGVKLRKEPYVDNLDHIPAFVIHGARDGQIHVSNSKWMVEELRRRRADVTYVEVDGGGHKFFGELLNPRVIRWVSPKKRKRLPRSFSWVNPRGALPSVIYWVSVEGVGSVKARIQGQVITVDTDRRPKRLRVWLPRGLVDARKPIRVVLNGKTAFRGKARDSARTALESFALTGDLRRVFTAAVDVPTRR